MIKGFIHFLMFLVGVVVASMLAVGKDIDKESDGNALNVNLLYTVEGKQVAYVDGWLGITGESGDSGDTIALDIAPIERMFMVPSSFNPSVGDTVYIDTTQVTGHTPNDGAYGVSSGANKKPLCKVTKAKDANDVLLGVVISKFS